MKMSEGGFVANHLNKFYTIRSQLSYVKVNFGDELRTLLILCSLAEIQNACVSNYVPSSETLKFDDVVGVIISKEM